MKDHKPDNIYAAPLDSQSDFAFDEAVARVFPDMIRRSVPGYTSIIPMIGLITEQYAQADTYCYDLGCSLGASTLAMRHGLKGLNCTLVAVDSSQAMLDRCDHYIELDNSSTPVTLVCADIRKLELRPCSVVTLNFTLQFLPPNDRADLLKRVYKALIPGGVLILSEKICFSTPDEQQHLEALHLQFKKANGYSDLEVSQKRNALEKVLLPETLQQHQERIQAAGFSCNYLWHQSFNFISLIAVK